MMSQWIKVDSRAVNTRHVESRNGIEIEVFVSPYDVPAAVRGSYADEIKKFAIDFRYLTEPEESIPEGGFDRHVQFFVGKGSKRLQRIVVDVDDLDANAVSLRIIKSIHALAAQRQSPLRDGNYEMASKVIEEKKQELFATAGT